MAEDQPRGVKVTDRFRRFAGRAAQVLGRPVTFLLALVIIAGWLIAGPIFRFSDGWQLAINTGTTIITFLMVFLIQATQNRDAKAIHLKLDELIRAGAARNIFADLENATEDELDAFQIEFRKLRERGMHSEDAAVAAHKLAHRRHRPAAAAAPAPPTRQDR